MNKLTSVTIIVPCRNEEKFIAQCLDSIIDNNYPKDNLEVLVIDGMSDDGTQDIISNYSKKYSFIHLLNNQNKIQSSALNIGIKHSKGDVIMRMDAHNKYSTDYISNCLKYLNEYNADNVGGICITLPGGKGLLAEAIAVALSHPFGVGNSYFRIGSKKPRFVDTVPFGCFRKDIFEKVGLFDEELVRNQDDEFNLRIIKNGGKILLAPDIVSHYYARDSILKLWKMYFQYGYFKPLVAKKIGAVLTWRQLLPSMFICSLLTLGILSFTAVYFKWLFLFVSNLYLIVNLVISSSIALKSSPKLVFVLPVAFATLHFSYGLGYLKGFLDFILLKRYNTSNVPLTR